MSDIKNKSLAKILIIDDEKDILQSLKDILLEENYSVFTAMNGKQAIKTAIDTTPDLILLDLRLPDMDGYDVCRTLKSQPETVAIPIIIISTRSKDTEKVVGLEVGADDYLTKPYNELELLARIRVALRRRQSADSMINKNMAKKNKQKPIEIDVEARRVVVEGHPIVLTRKEFDLLAYLMSHEEKALNRAAILSSVWGNSFDSLQGTVDTHVKTLRKKLGNAGNKIETVPGIGYRWKST